MKKKTTSSVERGVVEVETLKSYLRAQIERVPDGELRRMVVESLDGADEEMVVEMIGLIEMKIMALEQAA